MFSVTAYFSKIVLLSPTHWCSFYLKLCLKPELCFLTLQTVSVEQVLALFVALDPTFGTAHALASNPPQQPLTLIAVGGCGGRPHLEVVWSGAGDGIYQGLEGLLIDMTLLQGCRKFKDTTFMLFFQTDVLHCATFYLFNVRSNWPVLHCAGCWTSELRWCLPSWSFGLKTGRWERRGYFIFNIWYF